MMTSNIFIVQMYVRDRSAGGANPDPGGTKIQVSMAINEDNMSIGAKLMDCLKEIGLFYAT